MNKQLVFSVLMLSICIYASGKSSDNTIRAYRVVVSPVIQQAVPLQLNYIGNMEANNTASIKARVTGDVMSYHFKEGSFVKKGELLFTVDPRPYQAILDQAIAMLSKDEAELAYAKNQVTRYKKLAKEEFISNDDYLNYQTQAEKLTGQVQMDKAAIRLAKLNLNYCYVKAPFSGRTSQRLTDPGNLVESKGGAGDPTLITLKQMDPIKVTFAVPGNDLSIIQQANAEKLLTLKVMINGNPNKTFKGALWLIDNMVNISTAMILMQGVLPNPDEELWPGEFAKVILSIKTSKNTLLAPSVGISLGQTGPFVFVINEQSTSEKRVIKTGRTFGNNTIVLKGLKKGDRVVVEGQEGLQSGMMVHVGK